MKELSIIQKTYDLIKWYVPILDLKRYGNLYPQVIEFENILLAARKAQKGKRFRENVLAFNYNLEEGSAG